jgi:nitroimidazol reductase NimA-like FMN-containing flavoprotein (pyridoxamine 5'-phosphate oxidase superfamily)
MNPDEHAREILAANDYMTLATADEHGTPWASPVYFAANDDATELYWVSYPDARHSRNLAQRNQTGIVVFDSTVAPGTGQAVYMEATAEQVPDGEIDHALTLYPGDPEVTQFTRADVTGAGRLRLYRARVSAHYVLDDRDHRLPATP